MKRHTHMKGNRFELKTVQFVPTHAQHERAEGKKYERMEESAKRRFGNTSFVDNVGKNTKFVEGAKVVHKGKGPENFTREQFEESGKELAKTNNTTGLWYPHKAK
jgi:hypothetical protein